MKVVLDANVLIAALIARGVCSDLVEHCVVRHTLITAEPILNDVQHHLVEKFNYTQEEANEAIELFAPPNGRSSSSRVGAASLPRSG